jgi:hypothetical protein
VEFDGHQLLNQGVNVLHTKQSNYKGQACPIDAALFGGQHGVSVNSNAVQWVWVRWCFALKLDVVRVQQGG